MVTASAAAETMAAPIGITTSAAAETAVAPTLVVPPTTNRPWKQQQ